MKRHPEVHDSVWYQRRKGSTRFAGVITSVAMSTESGISLSIRLYRRAGVEFWSCEGSVHHIPLGETAVRKWRETRAAVIGCRVEDLPERSSSPPVVKSRRKRIPLIDA